MVVETVAKREETSGEIIRALEERGSQASYVIDLIETLRERGIEPVQVASTVWRLIDENRLFLDRNAALVLEEPERD